MNQTLRFAHENATQKLSSNQDPFASEVERVPKCFKNR